MEESGDGKNKHEKGRGEREEVGEEGNLGKKEELEEGGEEGGQALCPHL